MRINKVKLIIRITLLIATSITISSCEKLGLCKDEPLSIDKKDYAGAILRIDGLYYGEPDTAYDGKVTFNTIVLYSNGVVLRPGNVGFDEIDEYIESMNQVNNNRNTQYIWGLFDFSDTDGIIEYWRPAQCGYPIIRNYCEILNDSTFKIIKRELIKDKDVDKYNINELYRFKEISEKPDSTNNFIK